jgi:hypothetical protein
MDEAYYLPRELDESLQGDAFRCRLPPAAAAGGAREVQPVHRAPVRGFPRRLCRFPEPAEIGRLTPAQRLPGLVEDEQEVAGGHTQVHHPVELGFAADALLLASDMSTGKGRGRDGGRCAEDGSAEGADESVDRF